MTWFGNVSAWLALAGGILFAAGAATGFSMGEIPWAAMLAAALLLTGWYRTWRKMSGGLRLLAGAWGFAAGLLLVPSVSLAVVAPAALILAYATMALPYIALFGLALTVLHKESK